MGSVNCYLVKADAGYVLIDTGGANKRDELEAALASAGCKPGDLDLIAITHGDFDHTGNAAYLCNTFGAQIAMHRDDAGMLERGDMFWNRTSGGVLARAIGRLSPLLFGFGKSARRSPDLFLSDGDDLSTYGFEARVLSLPGHSRGSIGVLIAGGDLFCGDLFENSAQPGLGQLIDDPAAAQASVEKLSALTVHTVYPGHGQPFLWDDLPASARDANGT
jgi:glyoxylase-like metal-dependent hydrolase (beta-lactamase superfamily II)